MVPEGKYYLADAGFGACDQLLLPYRGVRYHLAEWGRANVRYVIFLLKNTKYLIKYSTHSPTNKEELFNLRHASARNVIERIFGVLKRRFCILIIPPAYSPELQAKIPAALCTIHNFIREFDSSEGKLPADNFSFGYGDTNGDGEASGGNDRSDSRRDRIASDMWRDYQRILEERGMLDETDEDSEEELSASDEWDGEDDN